MWRKDQVPWRSKHPLLTDHIRRVPLVEFRYYPSSKPVWKWQSNKFIFQAREKELWVLNGDVAAQKFLDNIEYMDRAIFITIKEALQKNMEGSETAWCQYGSLLHSSELLRRNEDQQV
jgi:hypothetical protein